MRFVLLTRDFPPGRVGGVASWVDDLAHALVEDGRRVEVWVESRDLVPTASRPFAVRPVRGRSWARWQGLWMAGAIASQVRAADTVIVAATWQLATVVAPMARRILVGAHGSDVTRLDGLPASFSRVARHARFLPVSRFLADQLVDRGVARDRVHPLPWPLPLRPVSATRREELVVVARLVRGKGVWDAILLAHRLCRPIRVVGDGPLRRELSERATREGLDVRWSGGLPRAEARTVLEAAAAVVILSSADSREGLGLTALEAAAAGVPAIGRGVGGVPEAVGPGVVLPADVPIHTLDLTPVRALLDDPEAGRRARQHLAKYHGPEACLAALDRLLDPPSGAGWA